MMTLAELIDMCDAIIGNNIVEFDLPFREWVSEKETLPQRLLIEIETGSSGGRVKALGIWLGSGLKVPTHFFFPSTAVPDCMTVLKLVIFTDIDQVVARAKSPRVYPRRREFDTNHLARRNINGIQI